MKHETWAALIVGVSLAAGTCGCTKGRGDEARAQFTQVLGAVKGGSLAHAYSTALPPSQDHDLNALLAQALELISEDEFQQFKEIVAKTGPKLAPLVGMMASRAPALAVLSEKLKDLPAALGLDSFQSFKQKDVKGLLESIDKGLFADFAKSEQVKARLDAIDVRVASEQGDWARLRFIAKAPDGSTSEDAIDVVLVDGKWLPASWASDWNGTMDALKGQLAAAIEAKKQDPDMVKRQLQSLAQFVDKPAPLVEIITKRLTETFGSGL